MKIIIIGIGSSALNVLNVLDSYHNFTLAGFVGTTEEVEKHRENQYIYNKAPILGDRSILPRLKDDDIYGFVVAIGDNYTRESAFYSACQAGLTPVNIVSDKACVDPSVKLGNGIIISAGAIISPGAEIGDNTIIDPGVIVDVNSMIGENCHLSPGVIVSGACEVDRNVFLGARTVVEPFITIGKNQNVKSGEIVMSSLEPLYREEPKNEK